MEIMQLIQQQSFFHEKNDAADSTACFSFWGGLGRAAPGGPPKLGFGSGFGTDFFEKKIEQKIAARVTSKKQPYA